MTEHDGGNTISRVLGVAASPLGGLVATAFLVRQECRVSRLGQSAIWQGAIWDDAPWGASLCHHVEVPTALGVGATVTLIGWLLTFLAEMARRDG